MLLLSSILALVVAKTKRKFFQTMGTLTARTADFCSTHKMALDQENS